MLRGLIWLLSALLAVAVTVVVALPAAWMSPLVEHQTGGRLTLGDPQGSLWEGSAFIGAAPGRSEPVTPLLPGRFTWSLSPTLLLGRVHLNLSNPAALSQDVTANGGWYRWQVSPAAIALPAERLAALGAPLNTVRPSGRMNLSWGPLQLARQGKALQVTGLMKLDMDDIASRLSPIRPLGAYTLAADWRGEQAVLQLTTRSGPLVLTGSGRLEQGRLRFSGRAEAAPGDEERLTNLLNLLGQRRSEGGRQYIELEFK
ncbi:type II secretion system protein N [Lacisediminimonas sp.]|uniref:type II secretion system protein N n=1 Tax=Lacisediminimonas sp. TaxID=3060582 RepID=UPI00271F5B0A|nr:type II secretion system protein N [Lacisediminimonas sp.]MDO8301224.1 type II secretion system protein N [Lacisediminimonas sp.]